MYKFAHYLILILNPVLNCNIEDNHLTRRQYKSEWEDLDSRPLPEWYDRAKIGIFVHWGVYSVPGFGSEWFWQYWEERQYPKYLKFMKDNYRPKFAYPEFASEFRAEFFDPIIWADLFAKSGARYVVFTSKHHDGYAMFPSNRSFNWNSVDIGPRRDITQELSIAIRDVGLKFGLYHSLYEWFNPLYLQDKAANFSTRLFPEFKLWPDLMQIVNDYKPSVIWSDGDWDTYDTYWNSTDFISWLYNESPVGNEVVVNDRWGIGTYCTHGDFYNCKDRYNPFVRQDHKWENAFTIDKQSWGYRRNLMLNDTYTTKQVISEVTSTVSCGGNVLINVGPTKDGTIAPIFEERLLELGAWLEINGDAIYDTSPWYYQNDTFNENVWFTCRKSGYDGLNPTAVPTEDDEILAIYAIFLEWPVDNVLKIGGITPYIKDEEYVISLLGNNGTYLQWYVKGDITNIVLVDKAQVNSTYAWTLKFIAT